MLALSALHAYESARPAEPVDARVVEAGWATMRDWTVFDRTASEVRAWRVKAGSPGADLLLHWPRPRLDGLVAASHRMANGAELPTAARSPVGHHRRRKPTGTSTVLWSDLRFCWDARDGRRPAISRCCLGDDGRRMACALWFGGEADADGRLVRQIVRVGTWVQTRR